MDFIVEGRMTWGRRERFELGSLVKGSGGAVSSVSGW